MNNLKGPFILSIALLLLGTVGGGLTAYKLGTTHEEASSAPSEGGQTTATSPEAPAGQPAPQGGANATAAEGAVAAATSRASGAPSANGTVKPTNSSNPSGEAPAAGKADAGKSAAGGASAGAGNADAGKATFATNCAGCHGAGAKGGVGPDLTAADGPKAWTDDQFAQAIHEGKAPDKTLAAMMPHFTTDQVTEAQTNDIHAFLKSLQ